MYIMKALLGSLLALSGLTTSLFGSILWLLQTELVSNANKLSTMEEQYFLQNFGTKFFIFLMVVGFIKAIVGIRTALPKEKNSKRDYGFLLS